LAGLWTDEETRMTIAGKLREEFLGRLGIVAREESGQALVEYALLLALIALVAIGAVEAFGLGVSRLYSTINSHFP
jgi:Flp pilus assembly pilin Flp